MLSIVPAAFSELPAVAELFQQAFPEALTSVFGRPRLPASAVEDVLAIIDGFEPMGFLVAKEETRVVGMMIVVSDLSRFYGALWVRGGFLKLLSRWLTGRYRGLGFGFMPRLWRAWRDYRSGDRHPVRERPLAQVLSIVVDQAHQGQGIGKALSERALAYLRGTPARVVRLEVDGAKAAPIALYKKFGFVERATIRSPRGPALVMTLQLK